MILAAGALATILWYVKMLVTFLVIIAIIATIHEGGHYFASKATGVRVDEFSLGFGKILFSRTWGETEYNVRAIPLGAFVRPAGMDPEEEFDEKSDPGVRSFQHKGLPAKFLILVGGSAANILGTMLIATSMYWFVGLRPTTIKVRAVPDAVIAGSPAEAAGVRPGDVLFSINERQIFDMNEGIEWIGENAGKPIALVIHRYADPMKTEGAFEVVRMTVTPAPDAMGSGKIGIRPEFQEVDGPYRTFTFLEAVDKGVGKTLDYTRMLYGMALGMLQKALRKGEVPKEIGGPVAIAKAVGETRGFEDFFWHCAVLSLSIGVFNLMPIPALDGGRILLLFLGGILDLFSYFRRGIWPETPVLDNRMEEYAHLLGFLFLIVMLVVVTWKDVKELFVRPEALKPVATAPAPTAAPGATEIPGPKAPASTSASTPVTTAAPVPASGTVGP